MDELYAIADVFVGKPGGLSTAESLRWNLPLIVCYTLPGQEEKNLNLSRGSRTGNQLGQKIWRQRLSRELQTGEFRQSLKTIMPPKCLKVFQLIRAVNLMLHGL